MTTAPAPSPAPPNFSRLQDADTLRSQIAAGLVEVDARLGQFQRTLLHMAVMAFRPDLVEVLLEFGADPRLEDTEGHSVVTLAVELRDHGLAGSADVVADPEGLVRRMEASVGLLEDQALLKNFMEYGLSFDNESAAGSVPAAPSQLLRLTSTGRPIKPPPASPLPPSLTRGVSIDGAPSATPRADLAQAWEVLGRRVEGGDQVFSDIGLWCVMQLHERGPGVSPSVPLPKRPRAAPGAPGGALGPEPLCDICLEPAGGLVAAPCGRAQCGGSFCGPCLTTYVQGCVAEIRYALPLVRCPATECRRRIPTRVWADLLVEAGEASVQQRIQRAGEALLKIRCPNCHQPRDLFRCDTQGTGDAASFGESVVQGLDTRQRLRLAREVRTFRTGGPAQDLLDMLGCLDAPQAVAPGVPPAKLEARFQGLCGVLSDPERAAALELAFYRRYPMITTKCCKRAMCFKCKVQGHHPGETCEERQAKELAIDAQYCPGCGVPTVKSEGCDHIVCVCGSSWTWRH